MARHLQESYVPVRASERALLSVVDGALWTLQAQLRKHAVLRGDFLLSSGRPASYYIDPSLACMREPGRYALGTIVREVMAICEAEIVGGPLAGAITPASASEMPTFYLRDNEKTHGGGGRVIGADSNQRALVVDDVTSSGDTLIEAVRWLQRETDLEVVGCYTIVDRDKGAIERVNEELDLALWTSFTMEDLGVEP